MPYFGGTLHWRCLTARPFLFRSQAMSEWKNGLTGTFQEQYNFVRFGGCGISEVFYPSTLAVPEVPAFFRAGNRMPPMLKIR
jgi:hypothetical protein